MVQKLQEWVLMYNKDSNYSLNYIPGLGQTCGKDIETMWSLTNSLAPSMHEMGSGAYKETLTDHWNDWNLHKIVGFCKYNNPVCTLLALMRLAGSLFLKQFKDACVMQKKHNNTFDTFPLTFKAETIAIWTKMVEDWISDHTKPNPYEEPDNSELVYQLYNCMTADFLI